MAILLSRADPFGQFKGGHYNKSFCEIILNSDPVVEESRLKIFLIYSPGGPSRSVGQND